MPLPVVQARPPIDAAFAEDVERRFLVELPGKTLLEALEAYRAVLEPLVSGALGTTAVACAAGCATCCHQPIYVSFVELAALVLSDEARFFGTAFGEALRGAGRRLVPLRQKAGDDPRALAEAWFAAKEPCLLLGADGRCTAHAARPFLCRNLFSDLQCTPDAFTPGGFADLGALARRLRGVLHRVYRLDRFDDARMKASSATFLLPQGLEFVRREVKRPLLFKVFREERAPVTPA